MHKPKTVEDLIKLTQDAAVEIKRPGLVDPFGKPTSEFGFRVVIYPLDNLPAARWIGNGLSLEEAIANLEETPRV